LSTDPFSLQNAPVVFLSIAKWNKTDKECFENFKKNALTTFIGQNCKGHCYKQLSFGSYYDLSKFRQNF
jgi:hypothetical protein